MNLELLFIRLAHIFILGVFLLYIGISKTKKMWPYNVLIVLGIVAVVAFLLQVRKENLFWVVWHMLVVGIVSIATGVMRDNSPDFLYKLLIILGSAAIGYHLIRLIQDILK